MSQQITNIVLEGGGVKGICHVGVIKILEDRGIYKNIKNFCGSSAGGLVATMAACGADSHFMKRKLFDIDLTKMKDLSPKWWIPFYGVYSFYFNKGIFIGDNLLQYCKDILHELVNNSDITFQELYDLTGNNLILTGTKLYKQGNIFKSELIYFNKDTYPTMSIAMVCRMTSSFPWVYQPVSFEEGDVIDGGLLNNYPIEYFDDIYPIQTTIGVKLLTDDEYDIFIDKEDKLFSKINDIKCFTLAIIDALYTRASNKHENDINWNRSISVNTGSISSMNMSLSNEDKEFLYNSGVFGALKYLNKI